MMELISIAFLLYVASLVTYSTVDMSWIKKQWVLIKKYLGSV